MDKILVSQDSLGKFMNKVSPDAYMSMTKVNFAALDNVLVMPYGVYGSRPEIVRFLQDTGIVNTSTYAFLSFTENYLTFVIVQREPTSKL